MSIKTVIESSAIREIASLVHLPTSRKRILAVLKAYFDESGTHAGSRICAIAGYLGDEEEWSVFERRWKRAIARQGLRFFHMADFESRKRGYEGWSDSRRKMFLNELLDIIRTRSLYGFASALVMEDYNQLTEEDKIIMTHGRPEAPYFLCFQHCVVEAALRADQLPESEKVSFVFDRQKEFAAEALRTYNDLKNQEEWERRKRLGAIAFESKEEFVPLQAADLLVYEAYKELENKKYNPHITERYPLRRLKTRPIDGKYFNTEAIQTLLAHRDNPTPRTSSSK